MNSSSRLVRQPILPKSSWLVRVWSTLLNVAIYVVLFWILAKRQPIMFHILRTQDVSLLGDIGWLITAVILILFLTTAVHELGHLLAGKWVGLRFHLLIIGPLRVTRENDKLRFGLNKSLSIFSGMAGCTPDDDHDLLRRLLIFTVGGPLASLLQTAVAFTLFSNWASDVHFLNTNAWVVEAAAITAVSGAIIFLSSMKPSRYQSGLPADGGRIISLLRGGATADRWCALVALNGADLRGQRPRDWDAALVRQALVGYDHTHDGQNARFLAYQWALDNGHIAEANRWLEEAVAIHPTMILITQARLIWEKAYLSARHLHDPGQARKWLSQIRPQSTHEPQHLRAETAVLLAEGDHQLAMSTAQEALTIMQQDMSTGVQKAEADWIQTMLKAKT